MVFLDLPYEIAAMLGFINKNSTLIAPQSKHVINQNQKAHELVLLSDAYIEQY